MRYYEIKLTPPSGSKSKVRVWSSYPKGLNGSFDPGAQNIDFDLLVMPQGTPAGLQSLTIEGVALQDILQASQFAPQTGPQWSIQVSGGMGPGLPLNNPKQAGVLVNGLIFQSFGNWQGTEMSLDFVFTPNPNSYENPGNIVLNWKAGTPLSQALANTFSVAFPNMKQQINISSNLVQNHDEVGYYHTVSQLAEHIMAITNQWQKNTSYPGVSIALQNGTVQAYDQSSAPKNTTQLVFTDLVGQPTWLQPNQMQLKLVMRADLQVGATIKLPAGMQNLPGMVQTTAASMPSSMKYKSAFTGEFFIAALRHLGNFRSTDAAQWVTIVNCYPSGSQTS